MEIIENVGATISVQENITGTQGALFTFLLFYLFTFQRQRGNH